MKLRVLGSSSKGNCYVLETPTGSLLIEVGLPWKQIQKGLNFDLSDIRGCVLSHEHKDHAKSVKEVCEAGIDVYMSIGTWEGLNPYYSSHRIKIVSSQFDIENFIVLPFGIQHDAKEPTGFLIYYILTGEKLLFATDTYYLHNRFKRLNYIMIECNYIKEILEANIEAGLIQEGMKNRLLESHFSLDHVKEFLQANDLSQVRNIVLLHLSEGNSDAARMIQEIKEVVKRDIDVTVAEPGLEVELELYPY